jgi:hypothetical protein
MGTRLVYEGPLGPEDVKTEDGGMAIIAEFDMQVEGPLNDPTKERGVWVALHSWDPDGQHEQWALLAGRRVRVTVEVID